MKRVFAAACAALLLICAAGAASAAAKFYSGSAIRSIFPGTYVAQVDGGLRILVSVRRSGHISARTTGLRDHGRWSVKKNQLCMTWVKFTRGQKSCTRLYKSGGLFVAAGFGRPTITFRRIGSRKHARRARRRS